MIIPIIDIEVAASRLTTPGLNEVSNCLSPKLTASDLPKISN